MPFPAGRWAFDQRGDGRGVRVSAHIEGGFLVLSTWKSDQCVATVRLLPDEAAQLTANLAEELAQLIPAPLAAADDLDRRVTRLESRVDALDHPGSATGSPSR